ncbi:hypothetical protein BJ165DRAFT_665477 [Panaeolus papilionaceus]|nr:hypothetical protein BJ165DRAFT_665477 [Panaeolus papilionaceus]
MPCRFLPTNQRKGSDHLFSRHMHSSKMPHVGFEAFSPNLLLLLVAPQRPSLHPRVLSAAYRSRPGLNLVYILSTVIVIMAGVMYLSQPRISGLQLQPAHPYIPRTLSGNLLFDFYQLELFDLSLCLLSTCIMLPWTRVCSLPAFNTARPVYFLCWVSCPRFYHLLATSCRHHDNERRLMSPRPVLLTLFFPPTRH